VSDPSRPTALRLPLAGRSEELGALRSALERVAAGRGGGTLVLAGSEGMGKSRLAEALLDEAGRRGFLTALGRAYPMESGVPYSLFCDLLDPLVREESRETLAALTRGAPEFQLVCPSLAEAAPAEGGEIPDLRNRLLWNFPGFLDRLRRDRPLLLVLEDLEHADPSSLELFHFLGRQARNHPFVLVATIDEGRGRSEEGRVQAVVRELVGRSGAELLELHPLGPDDVQEAISHGFGVDSAVVRGFARDLHRWTGGNPFFVHSILETLVAEGRLREAGGRWVGWSFEQPTLPRSVRDLVLHRLDGVSAEARTLADLAAVVGTRASHRLLGRAGGLDEAPLLQALEELVAAGILEEESEESLVFFVFPHPLVREVLYGEIGLARARLLHSRVARSMEALFGEQAMDRAKELAPHVMMAAGQVDATLGAAYLAAAGRQALRARADHEAARFLEASLDLLGDAAPGERAALLLELARARQRTGRLDQAAPLLERARELVGAARAGDGPTRMPTPGEVDRRLALVAFYAGDMEAALAHCDRGLDGARSTDDRALEARFRLTRSACLQTLARPEEAGEEAKAALRLGEEAGDDSILASAHRVLLLLHTWRGPPEVARRHGRSAIALAEGAGDDVALCSAHWAMAVLEGLTGHAEGVRRHLDVAGRLARELDSPLLRLQVAEVEIEYAAGLGEWDRGLDLAEESLRMARELDQRLALPRLLVSSALLHLKRGEVERARAELDEAWELVGEGHETGPRATHLAILAHSGRAALHLATGAYSEAIRVAERGLALVDQCGYTAWGIYRLLPILGEAALHLRRLDRAESVARRLRADSERFEHRLGLAWADTCDALVAWLRGDVQAGAEQMARAAERLEEVETLPDAARLRRQLAGRLAELGDRDAAIRELRAVHDVFAALGAAPELGKARDQFREVGARPPTRTSAPGAGDLTAREAEIARLVAARKSNKAIARTLDISPRTVGTHLTNIFRKLEIDSRTVLGDRVRGGLLEEG
jgi:DNA-binding CsgD family transcriptional regulator